MVGLYPDAPGRKFETDVDGSVGFGISINEATPFSAAAMTNLSKTVSANHVNLTNVNTTFYVGYIFPELRDIAGFCLRHNFGGWGSWNRVETSTNTTNGSDGTWTDRGAMGASGHFRTITALAVAGVKAIRFRWGSTSSDNNGRWLGNLHVFGSILATSNSDRLTLWHPTLDQELSGAGLDFGDVPRLSVPTKQFRVKNLSAAQTAGNIVLSVEAVNDTTPTVVGVKSLSFNGSSYAASQNIGDLAPGVISSLCTLKTAPGSVATLGPWRQRVKVVGAWT